MFGTQENVEKIVNDMNQPVELKDAKRVNGQEVANKLLKRDVLNTTSSQKENEVDLLVKNVEKVNQTYAISYYRDLTCSVPVIGKLVVIFKKVVRRVLFYLIQPIVDEQNAYNVSATQTINALNNIVLNQRIMIDQQRSQIEQLNGEIRSLSNEMGNKLCAVDNAIKEVKDEAGIQSIRLQAIKKKLDTTSHGVAVSVSKENEITIQTENRAESRTEANVYGDIDYFSFENAFRGSQESIRKSQLPYIKYFKDKENVIDIGCGRGEFLELLKEEGISATGVDLYDEFVEICKEKGLVAIQSDAIEYLAKQENQSLGGVFGAQLVEHLTPEQIVSICNLAYEKLEVGGCIILETPNPKCLSIYTNAFYIDPSHIKPVHPETLKYYLYQAGFDTVEIVYTESSKIPYQLPLLEASGVSNLEEFNSGINAISDIMFGSQDYAIIARK